MLSLATTTISVLRGVSTNDYGDDIDSDAVNASGIPASLLEQTRYVMDSSSNTPMTVRTVVGRVGANTDIKSGDRVKDEHSGQIYVIEDVTSVSNPLVASDTRLDLRRVD